MRRTLPELEPPGERVLAGLARIGIVLKSRAWRGAGPRGLTPTQAQILVVLKSDPAPSLRVGDVARRLGVTAATASDAVRALERKRLVRKARSTADARAVAVALTPAGRVEAEGVAEWPDVLLEAVNALTAEERRVLLRSLVKMVGALQARGEIPVARVCVTCRYFRPNAHADPERPHHCAFADAAFGDGRLRVDCADHEPAAAGEPAG